MADYRRSKPTGRGLSQPISSTTTPRVRLSCELCRQRKVKCDKLNPCTNCQRFGAVCIPVERARLPRGRSGKLSAHGPPSQDSSLKERVSRLEDLLRELTEHGDPVASTSTEFGSDEGTAQPSVSKEADKSEPYIENSFWADILRQIHDVRSAGSHSSTVESRTADNSAMKYRELLALPKSHEKEPLPPAFRESLTTIYIEKKLYQIFLEKIDPFFKILHTPSLSAFILDGKPYLDYEPGHLAPTTLVLAICYTAVSIITEDDSYNLLGCKKSALVAKYQKESEAALARADFMTTNDITILQAFVLFLLASRSQDPSRRVWTMLSMALRIAQALSLHLPEPPFPVRPFEREMRRRLWVGIGFLDIHCSVDRASEPMMQALWIQANAPLNVNDSDIGFGMDTPARESQGFTDMTFTKMILKAQCTVRLLNFTDFTDVTVRSVPKRQQLVIDFQEATSQLLKHSHPDSITFHWFTRETADIISASMQLIALRPLQRNSNFIPPRVRGDRLLQIAVDVLKKSKEIRNDPRAIPWQWVEFMFVPWHALAVAIAELCVCNDLSLMEKFWGPVRDAYERQGDLIADSRKGIIWKPMAKIMAQAESKRSELLNAAHPTPYPLHFTPLSIPVCSQPPTLPDPASLPGTGPGPTATTAGIYSPMVTLSETVAFGPWTSVWDAVDYGCPGANNEMSWLNYENFIEDVYGSLEYIP
ncbi:fungal-specific transcription factor domain-containing protein [Aspergillus avenaceus]|uniref:Fungal-specific transcription factor domain-containing protein n=1 Tax=Aspergillus avenaceus TaxID=36643 RepID=A0A5N6TTY9_ASPAV|nr:fungal-specific transcription factor domain-containing protein [Aspergillus avenaceus]